jgi:hypothetical protein
MLLHLQSFRPLTLNMVTRFSETSVDFQLAISRISMYRTVFLGRVPIITIIIVIDWDQLLISKKSLLTAWLNNIWAYLRVNSVGESNNKYLN